MGGGAAKNRKSSYHHCKTIAPGNAVIDNNFERSNSSVYSQAKVDNSKSAPKPNPKPIIPENHIDVNPIDSVNPREEVINPTVIIKDPIIPENPIIPDGPLDDQLKAFKVLGAIMREYNEEQPSF